MKNANQSVSVGLERYLPLDRRLALLEGRELPDRTWGCALFADVSGFTPLTEALLRDLGPQQGAEILARHLNDIYSAIIAAVHRQGGSVIAFSGDAITCWFERDPGGGALSAAIAMQRAMRPLTGLTSPSGERFTMGLKVSVANGPVRRFLVGDPQIQHIEVLAGGLMETLAAGESLARPGEVLLSGETARRLEPQIRIAAWRRAPQAPSKTSFAVLDSFEGKPLAMSQGTHRAPELSSDQLRPWVHPLIYQRWEAGLGAFLAELRPATAFFLRFEGLGYDEDSQAGVKLDRLVRRAQWIIDGYEGILMQLSTGDKGTYLYAAFGAPVAHEDDSLRAVSAAQALHILVEEIPFLQPVQIGVSRGMMRVGDYGSPARGIYGVQGNEANIAARLMTLANPGETLLAARVVQELGESFLLEARGNLELKGQPRPIPVFSVQGKGQAVARPGEVAGGGSPLVGRETELADFDRHLRVLLEGKGGLLSLEGEAGIGKTRLLAAWISEARAAGVPVLEGEGGAIERTTPYHGWRPIFRALFLGKGAQTAAIRKDRISAVLEEVSQGVERAPLLNAVLDLDWPENAHTLPMVGELRAQNTRRLLTEMLLHAIGETPHLLAFEDAHWLDSASWALLERVRAKSQRILFVLSLRPMEETEEERASPDPIHQTYRRMLEGQGTHRIILKGLAPESLSQMVAHRLGAERLSGELERFIWRRGEGHPYYSEEIALALRDGGQLRRIAGRVGLAHTSDGFDAQDFPDTIQGVLISRLDHLSPPASMTLKAASVLGRSFSLAALQGVDPMGRELALLREELAHLEARSILQREAGIPEPVYRFRHAMTQEVVYQLMLLSQRQKLHRAAARWYEANESGEPSGRDQRQAHHWTSAVEGAAFDPEDHDRALEVLARAAESALAQSAYKEAASFYRRGLALMERDPRRRGAPRRGGLRAHFTAKLGEAYRGWGRFADSLDYLERAAAYLGERVPSRALPLALGLLAQVALQIGRRLFPHSEDQGKEPPQAALIYQRLGEMYFFANRKVHSLFTIVRMLNMCEPAGPSAELAEALAAMSLTAGLFGLQQQAETYYSRAVRVAERVRQPTVTADVLRVNGLYRMGVGDWISAEADLRRALEIHESMGDRRHAGDCRTLLAHLAYNRGEYRLAVELSRKLIEAGAQDENPALEIWGHYQQGIGALRLHRPDQALDALEEALALVEGHDPDGAAAIYCYGARAMVRWRQGEAQAALRDAHRASALIAVSRGLPSAYNVLDGYAGAAEVYVGMLELRAPPERGSRRELERDARRACRALHTFRRLFPIGRPAAWLYQGLWDWHRGRRGRARRAWESSLEATRKLEMPFEQARARYEIGRHLPRGHSDRRSQLDCACELFAQIGAEHEFGLAKGALAP